MAVLGCGQRVVADEGIAMERRIRLQFSAGLGDDEV